MSIRSIIFKAVLYTIIVWAVLAVFFFFYTFCITTKKEGMDYYWKLLANKEVKNEMDDFYYFLFKKNEEPINFTYYEIDTGFLILKDRIYVCEFNIDEDDINNLINKYSDPDNHNAFVSTFKDDDIYYPIDYKNDRCAFSISDANTINILVYDTYNNYYRDFEDMVFMHAH